MGHGLYVANNFLYIDGKPVRFADGTRVSINAAEMLKYPRFGRTDLENMSLYPEILALLRERATIKQRSERKD